MKLNKLFILGAVLLTACTSSYRNILIETATPAAQMLPAEIKSLTLIDRASTADFTRYDEQEMQQHFFDKKFNTQAVVLDSLASDTTLMALGQLLYESSAYDVVIPQERYFPSGKKFYEMPTPLTAAEVSQICNDYQTDAVLALERYYNKVFTSYSAYELDYAVATIKSAYQVVINIYSPTTERSVQQVVVSDTIIWQKGGISTEDIFSNLPSIHQATIQTAIQSALDIDERISPQWHRENRFFFFVDKDDPEGKKAMDLANKQEWANLHGYWLTFEQSSKKSIRAKAQYNLALASEMLGNKEEAISWIEKSLHTKYTQQAKNYFDVLKGV
ncbi:MAG: DUF6340 family protein [Mangrovibacterium sp.]